MEKKNVLLIQGHPDPKSYNFALQKAYEKGLAESGYEYRSIVVRDLQFDPELKYGYRIPFELEPDLVEVQEAFQWADHVVLIFPLWWGGLPGKMKGMFDRMLLPGFAFKKRPNSLWWDRLLKGKTGRVITTMDQPPLYYRLNYRRPSFHAVTRMTLHFVGIRPVRTTHIGPVRHSSDRFREKWLNKILELGRKAG